jgi:hypothetical protein
MFGETLFSVGGRGRYENIKAEECSRILLGAQKKP